MLTGIRYFFIVNIHQWSCSVVGDVEEEFVAREIIEESKCSIGFPVKIPSLASALSRLCHVWQSIISIVSVVDNVERISILQELSLHFVSVVVQRNETPELTRTIVDGSHFQRVVATIVFHVQSEFTTRETIGQTIVERLVDDIGS